MRYWLLVIRQHYYEHDKRQHFFYSLFLNLAFLLWLDFWPAFLVVMLVGLGKEIYDKFWGSGFCWVDMIANFLGSMVAIPVFMILESIVVGAFH